MMEEIKEAIIGKPGLYCNGIRQFTGYVSDMGVLPSLFDREGNKIEFIDENGNNIIDDNTLNDILQGKLIVQPKGLWTRDIDGDNLPEWQYYDNAKIWAGWRGPYIDPPPDGILKDAWGNPFVFIIGELVTHNGKTYRCVKSHDAGLGRDIDPNAVAEPHEPGTADGDQYWKELPVAINVPHTWVRPGKDVPDTYGYPHDLPYVTEPHYADALTVISYGKDGKPGGEGLNKDLVLTIYKQEWTGEVAGHVGYRGHPYVDVVTLHYPKEGKIESASIEIVDNDHGYGINFRFGTACESDDPNCKIDCDYSEPDYICNYTNFKKVAIPIGIRSITTDTGKTYIFPVEATGNWIGTLK